MAWVWHEHDQVFKTIIGGLTPEAISREDTCFMRMAAAVLHGAHSYSASTRARACTYASHLHAHVRLRALVLTPLCKCARTKCARANMPVHGRLY